VKFIYAVTLFFSLLVTSCTPIHDKGGTTPYGKSSANLLSPQARLRKLSLHIRGQPPTLDEYEALRVAMEKGQANNFFKEKITNYLASPNHLGKMMDRLDEVFGVKVAYLPAEKFYWEVPDKTLYPEINYNSMDLIFQKVIKENLDWNYVFTAKEYKFLVPPPPIFGIVSDLGFYNVIRPELPPSYDGTIRRLPTEQDNQAERVFWPLVFDANDPRVAGAFTTSRFTGRYNTTLLNKNRKRAAALFRILLCDDMKPLIPADEDISDIVAKSFPKSATNVRQFPSDEIKHGTQQSCFACHQKLDPAGEVFRMTGNVLGAENSPGGLVYPSVRGDLVNIPVQGIGQLTQVTTEQSEYKTCQVRRFWDWFVGKDVPLSAERANQLAGEFDRLKRKPNDFAAYLVQQPEFQIDQSGTFSRDVTFIQVKSMFKQCSSCHAGVSAKNIPSFETLPFGGNKETHKEWLNKIIYALDLKGDGSKATMPPKDSGWTLTPDEEQDFRNWIAAGAQDENGNRTVDEILITKKTFNADHADKKTGVYGNSALRYLGSSDITRMFAQKFPNGWNNGNFCLGFIDQRAAGYFNPSTQEPYLKGPSLGFVKWFAKCVLDVSAAEFVAIKAQNLTFDKYLGKSVLEKTKGTKLEELRKNADTFPWADVPSDIQVGIVTHMIEDAIGWQVAGREYEILDKILKTVATMQNPMATDVIQKSLLVIMLQDEFLTY
jgi:hypothetical protein